MSRIVLLHRVGAPGKTQPKKQQPRGRGGKLRVQAVGLNRADAAYMRGFYLEQLELPSRIGYEAAGVVEAVGSDVGLKLDW